MASLVAASHRSMGYDGQLASGGGELLGKMSIRKWVRKLSGRIFQEGDSWGGQCPRHFLGRYIQRNVRGKLSGMGNVLEKRQGKNVWIPCEITSLSM